MASSADSWPSSVNKEYNVMEKLAQNAAKVAMTATEAFTDIISSEKPWLVDPMEKIRLRDACYEAQAYAQMLASELGYTSWTKLINPAFSS